MDGHEEVEVDWKSTRVPVALFLIYYWNVFTRANDGAVLDELDVNAYI